MRGKKPGMCPKPIGSGECFELCSGDNHCPGDFKCCFDGCCHQVYDKTWHALVSIHTHKLVFLDNVCK